MNELNEIRIGAVSYLNTKPLVHGLADPATNQLGRSINLSFDLPSKLATQLRDRQLDVALIPSVELLRQPEYVVVSDACIACRGPVWSVKLLSRCPLNQVRTVALDEGSMTSATMTRILFQQQGIEPELSLLPIGANWNQLESDAILLIGDRAMHIETALAESTDSRFHSVIDLGQWWVDQFQLPFVFATWTANSSLPTALRQEVAVALSRSRDHGLQSIGKIATNEAAAYQLSTEQCQSYLQDNLYFVLGEREKQGLKLFHELASNVLELDPNREVTFS